MAKSPALFAHFESIEDPRVERTRKHDLLAVIAITICAVVAGADGWDEISEFGRAKLPWLKTFLILDNGPPSADTIRRVISRLDPRAFQSCFSSWIRSVFDVTSGDVVSIDGKTLRGSRGKHTPALHLISAWRSGNDQICLGQVAADYHSNEITAVPELLKILNLKGCLVTMDAMGCQKEIVRQIALENEADYAITLKANQPDLYQAVSEFFNEHVGDFAVPHSGHEQVDIAHGRVEHRAYYISSEIEWLPGQEEWARLKSVGMVESWRLVNDKESIERRYYITSLPADAARFASAVRQHWSIENNLHWTLDVAFNEDTSRIQDKVAAENLAIVRKMSIALLQQVKTAKDSMPRMRKRCGWDDSFLLKVLRGA